MKKLTIAMAALAIVVWCSVSNVNARGGRGGGGGGGGGRGGGGGGMSRGGGGGGMSRPSPAARPSPASRPSAAARPSPSTRPATGGAANRSPSLSRPGGASPSTRPGGAGGLAGGAGGAGRVGAGAGAGAGTRPSQRQLNDFLGIQGSPKAGTGAATRSTASGIQSGSKTVTGPGGGSITVGGIGGSRTGPGGGTAAAGRVGVKVTGPGGNSYVKVGGGAAVRGPGGNTIAAGRGASFVNGQFVGGKTWGAVNGNFNRWGYYGAGWHAGYPGAWWPGKWAVAGTIWAAASWATAGSYCGCSEEPTYYDYGDNVTYQDGMVYESDQPVGTEQQYYDQASQIAATGQEAANEDWLPLGVFAFCKDGDSSADKLVQLAVNKDGVIRGNYHDVVADKVTPIKGAVDKKTQRVALQLEGNSSLVVETGLYNLTNDEAPVLVHLGKDDTVSRVLVRLKQPEGEAAANGG